MEKVYFDKNGNEIKAGMYVRFGNDGMAEKIYTCGDGELGTLATSEKFLKHHPDWPKEYYPLSEYYVNGIIASEEQ